MEQDFLLISKNYQQLFNIRINNDQDDFDKAFNNTLKHIIKTNNVIGKFKIINLYNGVEKVYKLSNKQLGGSDDTIKNEFQFAWLELKNYKENDNANKHHIDQLYKKLIIAGSNYDISNEEINNMFINLITASQFQGD